jgi:hypothetical protein
MLALELITIGSLLSQIYILLILLCQTYQHVIEMSGLPRLDEHHQITTSTRPGKNQDGLRIDLGPNIKLIGAKVRQFNFQPNMTGRNNVSRRDAITWWDSTTRRDATRQRGAYVFAWKVTNLTDTILDQWVRLFISHNICMNEICLESREVGKPMAISES